MKRELTYEEATLAEKIAELRALAKRASALAKTVKSLKDSLGGVTEGTVQGETAVIWPNKGTETVIDRRAFLEGLEWTEDDLAPFRTVMDWDSFYRAVEPEEAELAPYTTVKVKRGSLEVLTDALNKPTVEQIKALLEPVWADVE